MMVDKADSDDQLIEALREEVARLREGLQRVVQRQREEAQQRAHRDGRAPGVSPLLAQAAADGSGAQSALEAEMIRLNRLVKQQVSHHTGCSSFRHICWVVISWRHVLTCVHVHAGGADRDPGRTAPEAPGCGLRSQIRITAVECLLCALVYICLRKSLFVSKNSIFRPRCRIRI